MYNRAKLYPYTPPAWASNLRSPSVRLKIAQRNTPIHSWRLPRVAESSGLNGEKFQFFIKRDDSTGSSTGGNKIRKLDFILAEALSENDHLEPSKITIVTCGGIQSNHCRATAVAARELGMGCTLFLRSRNIDCDVNALRGVDLRESYTGSLGNILLDKMVGSELQLVGHIPYETGLKPRMERYIEEISRKSEEQRSGFLIPVGGSDYFIGPWGYIDCFDEMLKQNIEGNITDIVLATGSGGTACGIAVANFLTGSKFKIHAFTVCDNKKYFHDHINKVINSLGVTSESGQVPKSEEIISIVDGYKGDGYGLSKPEELEFIDEVSRETGVILDPVYTGKAAYGLVKEVQKNPGQFKGNKIMFLHTGGIFGLYDMRILSKIGSYEKVSSVYR
eukprot:Nk52_evm3s1360 gene=Nk52_evmTU3s1360